MKMPKIATIICAAVVLALPCVARAVPLGTVDILHIDYGAFDPIQVWGGGYDGSFVYGGVYTLSKTASSGQGDIWPDGELGSFCMELNELAPHTRLTYDVVMPEEAPVPIDLLGGGMGAAKAEYLRELWGRFFNPDWLGNGPFTSQQCTDAEAFAAAVWEIVLEDLPASPLDWDVTVDATAGELGFSCAAADTATANSWLYALNGNGPKADLRAFVHDGQQDFLVEVPEPATIVMLGIGGALSLVRRKRAAV